MSRFDLFFILVDECNEVSVCVECPQLNSDDSFVQGDRLCHRTPDS